VIALEALRASITLKEEDLKAAQSEMFVEQPPVGTPTPPPAAQNVAPRQRETVSVAKTCPNCQFQMPASAMFCPNCGTRQAA